MERRHAAGMGAARRSSERIASTRLSLQSYPPPSACSHRRLCGPTFCLCCNTNVGDLVCGVRLHPAHRCRAVDDDMTVANRAGASGEAARLQFFERGLHLGRPRISVALGENAASVERAQVLDKSPYDQLRRRRGIAWVSRRGRRTCWYGSCFAIWSGGERVGMGKRASRVPSAWRSRGVSAESFEQALVCGSMTNVAVRWAEKMRQVQAAKAATLEFRHVPWAVTARAD